MQPEDLEHDDLDDFLGAAAATPAWTESLEAVREPLLDWAAAAMYARHRGLVEAKGARGLQQMRQDFNLHLRHLLTAPPDQATAALQAYRRGLLSAIWLQRRDGPALATAQAGVLAEALVRFAPWPQGLRAAEAVALGLGCAEPIATAIAELLKMR